MMNLQQKPKSGQESEFVVNFLATFYLTIIVLTGIFEIILHPNSGLSIACLMFLRECYKWEKGFDCTKENMQHLLLDPHTSEQTCNEQMRWFRMWPSWIFLGGFRLRQNLALTI
jgi:hypothetical protein